MDTIVTGASAQNKVGWLDAHAARTVVILDACHSEAAAFLKEAQAEKGFGFGFQSPGLEKLAAGSGRVVLSSCRDEETSITYIAKGHSLFTYYILEGLTGSAIDRGDGLVHVMDLFHYVSEEVPRNAPKSHEQHPVLKAHAETNFPLALRRGGLLKGEKVTGAAGAPRPLDMKQVERLIAQLYPAGPTDNAIWTRAGGDIASLVLTGSGRASWHAAIRMLAHGGGGAQISFESLLSTALDDFPNNPELAALSRFEEPPQ